MHLNDHSLRRIDDANLRSLELEALRDLSLRSLADLKEARDRLHQGPENSPRLPSSRAPWERMSGGQVSAEDPDDGELAPELAEVAKVQPAEVQPARKASKQPGAPRMGRTQVFQAHEEQAHYPAVCVGCGQTLDPAGAIAYTGFQSVDLHWGDPVAPGLIGRELSVIPHGADPPPLPRTVGASLRPVGHRIAHDPTAVEILDPRQIQPAFIGSHNR